LDGELSYGRTILIRGCDDTDFEAIYAIINDAAEAYRGVIPSDCWKEPYMTREELQHEINEGVEFWGYEYESELVGVMGIQHVQDVALIRHSYVRTAKRSRGIGGTLLSSMRRQTTRPILVGTWADASWAIRFYEKHGFRLVSPREKDELLRRYWSIPSRQIETSVVLADWKWFEVNQRPQLF
jgi:N-acetylglutamate synthase-like GNAT family acetyltransferase